MKSKVLKVARFLLCLLCAGIFLLAGIGKFDLEGNMKENFANWGYGHLLLLTVGIVEVLGAVFLFVPKLRKYSVSMLILVMMGATVTHFRFYEELGFPLFSMGLIAALVLIIILDSNQSHNVPVHQR